jgi:hypothetical protein
VNAKGGCKEDDEHRIRAARLKQNEMTRVLGKQKMQVSVQLEVTKPLLTYVAEIQALRRRNMETVSITLLTY